MPHAFSTKLIYLYHINNKNKTVIEESILSKVSVNLKKIILSINSSYLRFVFKEKQIAFIHIFLFINLF